MTQTMRWFGPRDPVALAGIRQSGATGIVRALHDVPNGAIWSFDAIAEHRTTIANAGLDWTVVESLPVHEQIKTHGPRWDEVIEAYNKSLANLAANGITVITYNFMPLLDWTRTDLAWSMPDGALALRYSHDDVAVYDLHILCRPGADSDYHDDALERADRRFFNMDDAACARLERTILAGLPGSEESFTSAGFLDAIGTYADIDAARLRDHHAAFLEAICPVAENLGIRMVVHPDDPPFSLFGLPRVVSTEVDLEILFRRVPSPANGLCFCTGSLGSHEDNDLVGMIDRLGSRIGFLHLRAVERTGERDFHEAAHLEGSEDVAAIVSAIHRLSTTERRSIPMRPDHGHQMLDDLQRVTNPGYSLIGRMRGLAELRGLERGIAYARSS